MTSFGSGAVGTRRGLPCQGEQSDFPLTELLADDFAGYALVLYPQGEERCRMVVGSHESDPHAVNFNRVARKHFNETFRPTVQRVAQSPVHGQHGRRHRRASGARGVRSAEDRVVSAQAHAPDLDDPDGESDPPGHVGTPAAREADSGVVSS